MKTKLAAVLLAVIAGSATVGCISNDKSMVIVQDVVVDSTCGYKDKTNFLGQGTIDLGYFTGQVFYTFVARIYNNMPASSATINPDLDTMSVQMQSASVSFEWLRGKDKIADSLTYPELAVLQPLASRPAESIPMSGLLPAAAASGGGPGEMIALIRVIQGDVGTTLDILANEPDDLISSLALGVHITVHGTTQGGMAVSSNEFVFPIYFCKGCLALDFGGANGSPRYVCCQDTADPTDDTSPYCPGFAGQDYSADTKNCSCKTTTGG